MSIDPPPAKGRISRGSPQPLPVLLEFPLPPATTPVDPDKLLDPLPPRIQQNLIECTRIKKLTRENFIVDVLDY